jgi:lipopolysaccharide transport system ATP-binding protein
MSSAAIVAHQLGKSFRIGKVQQRYDTVREAIIRTMLGPARRIRSVLRGHASTHQDEIVWALRDASFEVQQGEVLGIVGRNGAGKSTLLKVLSRVTPPSEGHAEIRGRVGSLLEVGTGFHPELTGRENVFLNGAILGMRKSEIARKFDEIVAFAEVERFIDTPVKRYSSGMYLRLAFAVAAHLEPEVLVVDEVLAVGDAAFQKKCMGKMESVAGQGRTILFVSHNMPAITSLCTRALLLEKGTIQASGPATDVVAKYLSDVAGAAATASWALDKAPGNDGVKLTGVRLVDASGAPASTVNIENPVQLKISYYLERPKAFRLAASFFTQGMCAFATIETAEVPRPDPGHYESTVVIPGNLLAEGDYLVNVSAMISRGKKMHLFNVEGPIAFQVYDPLTGNSARGDYRERIGGALRPMLDWQTRSVVESMRGAS